MSFYLILLLGEPGFIDGENVHCSLLALTGPELLPDFIDGENALGASGAAERLQDDNFYLNRWWDGENCLVFWYFLRMGSLDRD